MTPTISQLCKIFATTAVLGTAIGLPTTAYARNQLGPRAWDPGGGDFRWNYGGLCNCGYWTHGYEDCVRRRIFIDGQGYRVVRWMHVCY
jgi:hypothetical protein